jgi:hypothetical protein
LVLPMGFSWAVYFAQRSHEHVLLRSGVVSLARRISDFAPSPVLDDGDPAWLAYVDNSVIVGTNVDKVNDLRRRCDKVLMEAGLIVHEVTQGSTTFEGLGVHCDGRKGVVGPTSKRLWRCYQCLTDILERPWLTSQQLRVVIGHLTFVWCFSRSFLSIPQAVFVFIERDFRKPRHLWASVLRELRWARDTLFLTRQFIKLPWDPVVTAVDACETGFGVVGKVWQLDDVRFHGNYCERWRFKHAGRNNPRLMALEKFAEVPTLDSVVDGVDLNHIKHGVTPPDFASSTIGDASDWVTLCALPYHFVEPMHVLEARSVVWSLRNLFKVSVHHHKRRLLLSDNFSAVFAFARGRACDPRLLRQVRRAGALIGAVGSRVTFRWIVSEANPADGPSRRVHGKGPKLRGIRQPISVVGGAPSSRSQAQARAVAADDCGYPRYEGTDGRGLKGRPSEVRSADSARGSSHFSQQFSGLSQAFRPPPGLPSPERVEGDIIASGDRQRLGHVHGRPFSVGIPCVRRQQDVGSVGVFQARVQEADWVAFTTDHRGHCRLGEAATFPGACTSPDGSGHRHCGGSGATTQNRRRRDAPAGVLLSSSVRGARVASAGHQGGSTARLSLPGSSDSQSRLGRAHEGTGVRRHGVIGQGRTEGATDQADARAGCRPSRNRALIQYDVPRLPADLQLGGQSVEGRRSLSSIQPATCGTVVRPLHLTSIYSRDQEERKMEKRSGSFALREVRAVPKRVATVAKQVAQSPHADSPSGAQLSTSADVSMPTASLMRRSRIGRLHGAMRRLGLRNASEPVVLELFAGSGRWTRACERRGFRGIKVDRESVVPLDMTDGTVIDALEVLLRNGVVVGLHASPPCTTFSIARRPAIRTKAEIWGIQGLDSDTQQQVSSANLCIRGLFYILRIAISCGIPFSVENPLSSLFWQLEFWKEPFIVQVIDVVNLDMCQFNCPWRKPTRFACFGLSNVESLNLRCQPTGHVCSKTGRPHQVLRGYSTRYRMAWTRVAQTFPWRLVHMLATRLFHSWLAKSIRYTSGLWSVR